MNRAMKTPTQKLITNMKNIVQIIERYVTRIKVVGYWLLLDVKLVYTLEIVAGIIYVGTGGTGGPWPHRF